jgi:hypothetical protein
MDKRKNIRTNKRKFTNSIKNYYIVDDNNDIEYISLSLENAKEYCMKNDCTGITFQNNIYQVKKGFYIKSYGIHTSKNYQVKCNQVRHSSRKND